MLITECSSIITDFSELLFREFCDLVSTVINDSAKDDDAKTGEIIKIKSKRRRINLFKKFFLLKQIENNVQIKYYL